jgi:hypothetical protein
MLPYFDTARTDMKKKGGILLLNNRARVQFFNFGFIHSMFYGSYFYVYCMHLCSFLTFHKHRMRITLNENEKYAVAD